MRLVPVANPNGLWIYLSPVDFVVAAVAATLVFGLILSLALVSFNFYHQLSLLRLITSQTPHSSLHSSNRNNAVPSVDARFPSYWSDRPHLPPISSLRQKLYLCVDLTCLCFDYSCYFVAWGRWLVVAVWFYIKSLIVFLMAEIPYRCKLLYHVVVALTLNQWGILAFAQILCFVLGGSEVSAAGIGLTVIVIVLTASPETIPASPSLPPAKLFARFQSATNSKKLGPGFCPDTPTRPLWSPAPVIQQQALHQKHPSLPTQRKLFQRIEHETQSDGNESRHNPTQSKQPSQTLAMRQVSNPRRRGTLQSPAKTFRPIVMHSRPQNSFTISGDVNHHNSNTRSQRMPVPSDSLDAGIKGTPFAPQHPSRLRSVANANLTSSSNSSHGSASMFRQPSPSRSTVHSTLDPAPFQSFFCAETPIVPQRRRQPTIETPVIPPSVEGDLMPRALAGRDRPKAGHKADRYTSITEISTPSFLVSSGHMEDPMRRRFG